MSCLKREAQVPQTPKTYCCCAAKLKPCRDHSPAGAVAAQLAVGADSARLLKEVEEKE
jgi:hypothetical protein